MIKFNERKNFVSLSRILCESCSIISAPTFLLYVKMMQSARMQKTKNPPALAMMTRRLREGGGLSEVELSLTALKSVTPGRRTKLNIKKYQQQQSGEHV